MFKTLAVEKNFLGIEEPDLCSFDLSKVVVVPVPYEHTVSYGGGTKYGPSAILDASRYVEFYDEETGREIYKDVGVATLQPLAVGKKNGEAILELLFETT